MGRKCTQRSSEMLIFLLLTAWKKDLDDSYIYFHVMFTYSSALKWRLREDEDVAGPSYTQSKAHGWKLNVDSFVGGNLFFFILKKNYSERKKVWATESGKGRSDLGPFFCSSLFKTLFYRVYFSLRVGSLSGGVLKRVASLVSP